MASKRPPGRPPRDPSRGPPRDAPRGGKREGPGGGSRTAPPAERPSRGRPPRDSAPRDGRSRDATPADNPRYDRVRNPYVRYQKLSRPPLKRATTTLWQYPHQQYGDGRQGDARYAGATPSWVVWQVLERYTAPGDVVLDPFCGSGTTLDVCKDTGRRGIGFDLASRRADIQKADARALPLDDGSVDHAFLDPPYADNLAYSDDEACIGKLPAEEGAWLAAMEAVLDELDRVVRPGGTVSIYVQDTVRAAGRGAFVFHPLGLDLAQAGRARWELVEHVAVVRGNAKLEDSREHKKGEAHALVRGFNHLLVFKKARDARRAAPRKTEQREPGRPSGSPRSGPSGGGRGGPPRQGGADRRGKGRGRPPRR